jgi:hypothetical protein
MPYRNEEFKIQNSKLKKSCGTLCHCVSVVIFFILPAWLLAQQNIITVGIQYKPVFTVDLLSQKDKTVLQNGVNFSIGLNSGFAAGMVIRRGITDTYSIEGGINYVKRTYEMKVSEGNVSEQSKFRIISYEIPVSGLIYIHLSEQFYMNASLGIAADMFASDVTTLGSFVRMYSLRKSVINAGVIANLGWEFRTEKAGYFYLGASYHNPFSDIYLTRMEYDNNTTQEAVEIPLSGTYFTLDVRYFFPEAPIKKYKNPTQDEE